MVGGAPRQMGGGPSKHKRKVGVRGRGKLSHHQIRLAGSLNGTPALCERVLEDHVAAAGELPAGREHQACDKGADWMDGWIVASLLQNTGQRDFTHDQ